MMDRLWRIRDRIACWYCRRHGHAWGKGGTAFDGEQTVHWAECRRCGVQDSD